MDIMGRRRAGSVNRHPSVTGQSSLKRGPSIKHAGSVRIVVPSGQRNLKSDTSGSIDFSPSSVCDASSIYSIPLSSVPARASSQKREGKRAARHIASKQSPTPSSRGRTHTVPNRGQSRSPVKQVGDRLDPVASDTSRCVPSRTFVRTSHQRDVLEFPTHRHPRVSIDMQIAAPLFVGGGSIEGSVKIVVDDVGKTKSKKTLLIERIAVDLVGVEESSGNRKAIFLSLGTELIDSNHPPPRNMVETTRSISNKDPSWPLIPSLSTLPFMMSLPLDTGPPPFRSKHARIRFILCTTMLIKDAGRVYLVRCSQDIFVLSTYDPEKALRSLPSPLTSSDEHTSLKSGAIESVKVTAGLHRQVWFGGSSIFVDVHIANNSRKTIKKLELSLERDILCYRHAAAGTLEQSASQARMFESNDRTILSKSVLKHSAQGWSAVEAYGTTTRTCELDIPRGHATVKCGKFFEVRYFLNISVSTSHTKLISIQLPIILIHMNSLDVLPNAVAQVAAAIEEKRSHHTRGHSRNTSHPANKPRGRHQPQADFSSPEEPARSIHHKPSRVQGRAFAAPRQQSLERMRAEAADMEQLCQTLDASPRKYLPHRPSAKARDVAPANTNSSSTHAIHKKARNPSLGGISVGSYTVLADDSSVASRGASAMEYVTPPSKRKARFFDPTALQDLEGEDSGEEGFKEKLRRLRSVRSNNESVRSHRSNATTKSKWRERLGGGGKENVAPEHHNRNRGARSALDHRDEGVMSGALGAYALGLTNQVQCQPQRRPSRSGGLGVNQEQDWQDADEKQTDRGRFEFRPVKRRPSAKFKYWLGGL